MCYMPSFDTETIFMHVFSFIKFIFAYYQMCFCLLLNVNMIAVKFVIVDSDQGRRIKYFIR